MARRQTLAALHRQCVHQLAQLYRIRGGKSEAIVRLRTYWQTHQSDEDALRPLLELLGEQERYQEARDLYEQTREVLAEEGRQPDPRTQDIAEYLRTKQIRRERNGIGNRELTENFRAAVSIAGRDDQFSQREYMRLSTLSASLAQNSNSELLKGIIDRNFSKTITYDLLSSNIKTMNFRDEWQYVVNNIVSETKASLRAMVFDVELTRWWNTIAGQMYMMTNMELLKKGVPIKRIFILSSLDARLRMNTLMNAYIHHKIGIDVRVCRVTGFQNSLPFKPDMFSVHDNLFVALYYFSFEKPITNLLLEDKYISEFSSFYDELFRDDRLCNDIGTILSQSNCGESFFTSVRTQLDLLQNLEKVRSVTELAKKL